MLERCLVVTTAVMLTAGCGSVPDVDETGTNRAVPGETTDSALTSIGLTFGDGTTAPKVRTIPPDPDQITLKVTGSALPVDGKGVSLGGITAPFHVVPTQSTSSSLTLRVDLGTLPANAGVQATYNVKVHVGDRTTSALSLTVRRDFEIDAFTFGDGTTGTKTRTLPSTAVHFKVLGHELPFDRPADYALLGAPGAATLDAASSSESQLTFTVPLDNSVAGQYLVSARVYNRSTPALALDLTTSGGSTGGTTNCKVKAFVDNNHFKVLAVSGKTITADVDFTDCGGKGELRRQGAGGLAEFVGDVVSLSGNQVTFDPGTLPSYCLPVAGEELYLLWM